MSERGAQVPQEGTLSIDGRAGYNAALPVPPGKAAAAPHTMEPL